jgi:hypothetical protein
MTTDVLEPDSLEAEVLDPNAPEIETLATFLLEGEEIGDAHYSAATQKALLRLVKRLLQRDPVHLEAMVFEANAITFDPEAPIEEQLAQAAYKTILQSAHRPSGPLPGEMDWPMYEQPTDEDLQEVGLDPEEVDAVMAPKWEEAAAQTEEAIRRHVQA